MYGASKAALNRLTNGLGAELYGTGIRVNTVEPRGRRAERRRGRAGRRHAAARPDRVARGDGRGRGPLRLPRGRHRPITVSLDNIEKFGLTVMGSTRSRCREHPGWVHGPGHRGWPGRGGRHRPGRWPRRAPTWSSTTSSPTGSGGCDIGGTARALPFDVTDLAAVQAAFAEAWLIEQDERRHQEGRPVLLQEIFADDYRGAAVTFRGQFRTPEGTGLAGLFLRVMKPRDPHGPFTAQAALADPANYIVTLEVPATGPPTRSPRRSRTTPTPSRSASSWPAPAGSSCATRSSAVLGWLA